MLASLIIVFREVLEAGLVVGIVLAATQGLPGRGRWIAGGIGAGVLGACVVAGLADVIYAALDGAGQDAFNASVLGLAVLMLAWHNIWMARHAREIAQETQAVGEAVGRGSRPAIALAMVVGLAVLREGAEVVLFLYGIAASGGAGGMLAGGTLGVLLGATLSWLVFVGLLRLPTRQLFRITGWLITLLAAGMASQAVAVLQRAGWLDLLTQEVWDSSWLLRDDGLLGKVLHTLVGYSDRPSAGQLVVYLATLALIVGLTRVFAIRRPAPRGVAAE